MITFRKKQQNQLARCGADICSSLLFLSWSSSAWWLWSVAKAPLGVRQPSTSTEAEPPQFHYFDVIAIKNHLVQIRCLEQNHMAHSLKT